MKRKRDRFLFQAIFADNFQLHGSLIIRPRQLFSTKETPLRDAQIIK